MVRLTLYLQGLTEPVVWDLSEDNYHAFTKGMKEWRERGCPPRITLVFADFGVHYFLRFDNLISFRAELEFHPM